MDYSIKTMLVAITCENNSSTIILAIIIDYEVIYIPK